MDDQIPDRDAATLGMDAKAFPVFWRDVPQDLWVRVAKQSEQCERLLGRTGGIVSYPRPQILIKSRQLDPSVFHHLTIAPGRGNLVFGKVCKNLTDRPLVSAGPPCELLIGCSGHQFRENRWRLLLQF